MIIILMVLFVLITIQIFIVDYLFKNVIFENQIASNVHYLKNSIIFIEDINELYIRPYKFLKRLMTISKNNCQVYIICYDGLKEDSFSKIVYKLRLGGINIEY